MEAREWSSYPHTHTRSSDEILVLSVFFFFSFGLVSSFPFLSFFQSVLWFLSFLSFSCSWPLILACTFTGIRSEVGSVREGGSDVSVCEKEAVIEAHEGKREVDFFSWAFCLWLVLTLTNAVPFPYCTHFLSSLFTHFSTLLVLTNAAAPGGPPRDVKADMVKARSARISWKVKITLPSYCRLAICRQAIACSICLFILLILTSSSSCLIFGEISRLLWRDLEARREGTKCDDHFHAQATICFLKHRSKCQSRKKQFTAQDSFQVAFHRSMCAHMFSRRQTSSITRNLS